MHRQNTLPDIRSLQPIAADEWMHAERARMLGRILPWLLLALAAATIAAFVGAVGGRPAWQLWTMAGLLLGSTGACALAVRWNRRGQTKASSYLIITMLIIIGAALPLWFDNLIVGLAIMGLLIALLAGVIISSRAGYGFALILTVVGLIIFFLQDAGVFDLAVSLGDEATQYVDLAIFLLTVVMGTYLVSLNQQGTRRALGELIAQSNQLKAANELLEQRVVTEREERERVQATVQQYVDYMAEMARGNLSTRLPLDGEEGVPIDPLRTLGHSLNETTASLQRMILQIREAATNLNILTADILAATTEQAAGASEQSVAIAQTSSTIEEVRRIAEQTAQRARSVADLAQQMALVSEAGQQAATDTISGMTEVREKVESIASDIRALSEQTQAIENITATVNEIATRSKLLALNAAVEAARAGEAGKGFAVVAQEVRSLAEQSREATDQIQEILSEVQRGVEVAVMATEEGKKRADVGTRLAGEAGQSIHKLGESVATSTQAALQIATAAGQQLDGMEQISQATEHIHQVAAQSVASARQTEQSAGELSRLAGKLSEMVGQYRL